MRTASILITTRDVAAGTLLRASDVNWKQVPENEVRPGFLVQSQTTEADYMGAIMRRDVASGAALTAGDLLKASDQRFLAATLTKGARAVTLSFEPPQSPFGLTTSSAFAQPGDHVDVILTQQLETSGEPGRRLLGETILRDLKIIAVDRSLVGAVKAPPEEGKPGRGEVVVGPRTVTFEVTESQAQALFVGSQLGRLHLSVRPTVETALAMAGESENRPLPSTWAVDVSPALVDVPPKPMGPASGSTIESSIRRVPSPVH